MYTNIQTVVRLVHVVHFVCDLLHGPILRGHLNAF